MSNPAEQSPGGNPNISSVSAELLSRIDHHTRAIVAPEACRRLEDGTLRGTATRRVKYVSGEFGRYTITAGYAGDEARTLQAVDSFNYMGGMTDAWGHRISYTVPEQEFHYYADGGVEPVLGPTRPGDGRDFDMAVTALYDDLANAIQGVPESGTGA